MTDANYTPRVVDEELALRLAAVGGVVIEGPKSCGKTESARQKAKSEVLLDLQINAVELANTAPQLILAGATPRLLDEWQVAPALWNVVRRTIDERRMPGQFILTGSATPDDNINRHTGAGRFGFLRMRPMSLLESGVSTGMVSLAKLLDGESQTAQSSETDLQALIAATLRGGWPIHQPMELPAALRAAKDYLRQVVEVDVGTVATVRRPEKLRRLIRALARATAQDRSISKLATESELDRETVKVYLEALQRLMIVEPQPAWSSHLRSKAPVITRPRWHLCCPSLAAAALNATPAKTLDDLNTFGFLFESLVVRDLRVYSQPRGSHVSFFRDSNGREVDAIVESESGAWGAFEVKLGANPDILDKAAKGLLAFAKDVDPDRWAPSLVVVTGSGHSYRRADGVHVVSISTLGP